MSKLIDLIGETFGRLIVIQRMSSDKGGNSRWLCLCNCKSENKIIVLGCHLKNGHTKSCGCLRIKKTIERLTKHGHSSRKKITETYQSWYNMIQRCTNPNNPRYKDYGGRGIKVCERWLKFKNFNEDMGEAPEGLQIERINNNKGYLKENCKWVTSKEQMRNTRDNLHITYNNKTQLLIEWSEKTRIPYKILWDRIYKLGWPSEKALTTPVEKNKRK